MVGTFMVILLQIFAKSMSKRISHKSVCIYWLRYGQEYSAIFLDSGYSFGLFQFGCFTVVIAGSFN